MLKPARRCMPAGAAGFTLIELIITITLLGVLMALAMPVFTTWTRNTQVRSVAEALQNGVRLAQAEAVRRNRQVVMTFTNDANPTVNPTPAANGKNWAIQTVASPYSPPPYTNLPEFIRSGVLTDVASGATINGVSTLCFNANGRLLAPTGSAATVNCTATASTFQIAQSNADRPLNVTVAVGGQVRMCDPNRPPLSSASPDGC